MNLRSILKRYMWILIFLVVYRLDGGRVVEWHLVNRLRLQKKFNIKISINLLKFKLNVKLLITVFSLNKLNYRYYCFRNIVNRLK